MKDAVCFNKSDMFSSPWCLGFTTYGLLRSHDVTNVSGGSWGCCMYGVAADPADFPSAYPG